MPGLSKLEAAEGVAFGHHAIGALSFTGMVCRRFSNSLPPVLILHPHWRSPEACTVSTRVVRARRAEEVHLHEAHVFDGVFVELGDSHPGVASGALQRHKAVIGPGVITTPPQCIPACRGRPSMALQSWKAVCSRGAVAVMGVGSLAWSWVVRVD